MSRKKIIGRFLGTTVLSGAALAVTAPAFAQDDQIIVTGTRIQDPNIVAASPVNSLDAQEIGLTFTPNIERVFRDLPITIPGDGENVNNGSAGQTTVNLRGLGNNRSLVLVDGKRLNPFDVNGIVSIDVIPMIMLDRVDIITGGASAVYGSDAMSGAINFIMKKNFEGMQVDAGFSTTEQGGGDTWDVSVLVGSNFADGRGNVTVAAGYTDRDQILFGQRDFGVFGVSSATGAGLGSPPPAPPANCSGNSDSSVDFASGVGSTTAIPGTLNLRSGNSYQFRDDMSLVLGECANHNFNPFNLYQRPQTRWQAMTTATYELNENVEMYGRAQFTSNTSAFEIAPSGTFGQTFTIPIMNPFFTSDTRQTILDDLNAFAAANAGVLPGDPLGFGIAGIIDVNGDGVFDENDAFLSTARRRTTELGPRTGIFDTDSYQFVWGLRGELPTLFEGWSYDLSWQRGHTDFVETRDGFTNLTNLAAGINTIDPNACISVTGVVTPAPCTPINVFGPEGSITDAQRDSGYFIAIANDIRKSTQTVIHGSISGNVGKVQTPWADNSLALALGFEYRKETANSSPDECLKLPPASCQGGAGGNRLPIAAEYRAWEGFVEGIWPVIENRPFFESFQIEAGYRYSDFNPQGKTDTWKAGASWLVTSSFRLRYMEQQAVRVANIGELGTPITTGLDNATFDPCSVGNPNPPAPGSALFDLCVSTGVPPSLVGLVPDIIAGQVNVFNGTDVNNLPAPETARTRTAGFVWQPDLGGVIGGGFGATTISVDYYDIKIRDFINQPTGQEALDLCYVLSDADQCAGIVRIGGALTVSGTGVPAVFTNFDFFRAEGIELALNSNYDLNEWGTLGLSFIGNYYLKNEFQTTATSPIVDCKGRYGTSCDPVPQWRHTMRVLYGLGAFDASVLWRRIGGMEAQANEAAALFPAFRSIDAHNYFDFTAGFQINETARISGQVRNLANKNPPIIGNETGTTAFNSGNTFPSLYDVLGRTYSIRMNLVF